MSENQKKQTDVNYSEIEMLECKIYHIRKQISDLKNKEYSHNSKQPRRSYEEEIGRVDLEVGYGKDY